MSHKAALMATSNGENIVKKRSIILMGHATSVSLEDIFWDQLTAIAKQQQRTRNDLIAEIDQNRAIPLSSALRVYCLCYQTYLE